MFPAANLRFLALGLLLSMLGGCAAISTVTTGREPLEIFELRPLPPTGRAIAGDRHLQLEPPAASGAISTDRIIIKPSALQVEYLPGARWADEAPEHVQLLLSESLTRTGRFALVSMGGAEPDVDYYLLTDVQAFQAEASPDGTVRVVVRMKLTLVDDADRGIVAARSFEQSVHAADPSAAAVIPAFDQAMLRALDEIVAWTVRMIG